MVEVFRVAAGCCATARKWTRVGQRRFRREIASWSSRGPAFPADGIVIDGRSSLDTSALTGESLPVDAVPGSEVLAGSLNQFGAHDRGRRVRKIPSSVESSS